MVEREVNITGRDIRECAQAIGLPFDRHSWLTIQPEMPNYINDRLEGMHKPEGYPEFTRPTEQFRVNWSNGNERFTRIAKSVKELYQILTPIFQNQIKAKKMMEKQVRNMNLAAKGQAIKVHRERISVLKKQLETAEANLERELES